MEFGYLIDLMVMCVDVVNVEYFLEKGGIFIYLMEGLSFVFVFDGEEFVWDVIYWEYEGNWVIR